MSNGAPPTDPIKSAAGEFFQTIADQLAAREQIRTQALADAWDTPVPSITRNTTNNFTSTSGATAPATAAPTSGGFLKTAAVGAAIAAGGAGLLGGGALLNSFLNPPSAAQSAPPGQVTIGINPDGTLFDPNAGASK